MSGLGVRCYAVPRRYAAAPLAEQLIGYLDSEEMCIRDRDLLDAGKVGGALVGQQHELLDHALALAGSALLDVDTTAILVEDELDFAALDVHAAALLAQAGAVAVQLLHLSLIHIYHRRHPAGAGQAQELSRHHHRQRSRH